MTTGIGASSGTAETGVGPPDRRRNCPIFHPYVTAHEPFVGNDRLYGSLHGRITISMNGPHIVALRYRVHHHDWIDYSRATPLVFDTPEFRVTIDDRKAV